MCSARSSLLKLAFFSGCLLSSERFLVPAFRWRIGNGRRVRARTLDLATTGVRMDAIRPKDRRTPVVNRGIQAAMLLDTQELWQAAMIAKGWS